MNITDEAGTHGNRAHQPPEENPVVISAYKGEEEIKDIVALVEGELSEPYTIFTVCFLLSCSRVEIILMASVYAVQVCGQSPPQQGNGLSESKGTLSMTGQIYVCL